MTVNTINNVEQTAFWNLPSCIQQIHYWVCSCKGLIRYRKQTHRLSTRSVLLPTSMMITSLPRSVRTSSTHRDVFENDCRSAIHEFVRITYIRHYLTWILQNYKTDREISHGSRHYFKWKMTPYLKHFLRTPPKVNS